MRRISNSDRGVKHSISSAILPGCASLVVPLLVATALELPAAAIDRIAAPILGRTDPVANLQRLVAQGPAGGTRGSFVTVGGTTAAGHAGAGPLSILSASAASRLPVGVAVAGDGAASKTDDWSTSPFAPPDPAEQGDEGPAGDPGTSDPSEPDTGSAGASPSGGAEGDPSGPGSVSPRGDGSDDGPPVDPPFTDSDEQTTTDSGDAGATGGSGTGDEDTSSLMSSPPLPADPSAVLDEVMGASTDDPGTGGADGPESVSSASGDAQGDDDSPDHSGNAHGHNDGSPGNSGNAPGHNKDYDGSPGNSGNAPGHNKDDEDSQ